MLRCVSSQGAMETEHPAQPQENGRVFQKGDFSRILRFGRTSARKQGSGPFRGRKQDAQALRAGGAPGELAVPRSWTLPYGSGLVVLGCGRRRDLHSNAVTATH